MAVRIEANPFQQFQRHSLPGSMFPNHRQGRFVATIAPLSLIDVATFSPETFVEKGLKMDPMQQTEIFDTAAPLNLLDVAPRPFTTETPIKDLAITLRTTRLEEELEVKFRHSSTSTDSAESRKNKS